MKTLPTQHAVGVPLSARRSPDAMVVVDQAGEIVLLNLQAEKQFGYSRDELVGQPVTNIIPEGFAERLIADDLRSAADALAQQIGTGIELSARRKDGTEFPIEIMLSPLDSAEGILVTAAIRDITVRRAAEQHLAQRESSRRLSDERLRKARQQLADPQAFVDGETLAYRRHVWFGYAAWTPGWSSAELIGPAATGDVDPANDSAYCARRG